MNRLLRVAGCPLCDLFKDRDDEIVITNCMYCGKPIIVWHEHVDSVQKATKNKMIYLAKKEFNRGVRVYSRPREILDHYYCHIKL